TTIPSAARLRRSCATRSLRFRWARWAWPPRRSSRCRRSRTTPTTPQRSTGRTQPKTSGPISNSRSAPTIGPGASGGVLQPPGCVPTIGPGASAGVLQPPGCVPTIGPGASGGGLHPPGCVPTIGPGASGGVLQPPGCVPTIGPGASAGVLQPPGCVPTIGPGASASSVALLLTQHVLRHEVQDHLSRDGCDPPGAYATDQVRDTVL